MSINVYNDSVKRLLEYRKKNGLSQECMCEILGVNQSHYSKLEQGKILISYAALIRLQNNDVDIDYLITGKHHNRGKLDEYIQRCAVNKRADMLSHIVWVIKQGVKLQRGEVFVSKNVDYRKIVTFLEMRTDNVVREQSAFKTIRKLNDKTQQDMATELNVNIKKYRTLEKGETVPDAQILSELYDKMGYFPSLLMPDLTVNLSYLNELWESFDKELQEELLEHIEDGFNLINKVG